MNWNVYCTAYCMPSQPSQFQELPALTNSHVFTLAFDKCIFVFTSSAEFAPSILTYQLFGSVVILSQLSSRTEGVQISIIMPPSRVRWVGKHGALCNKFLVNLKLYSLLHFLAHLLSLTYTHKYTITLTALSSSCLLCGSALTQSGVARKTGWWILVSAT